VTLELPDAARKAIAGMVDEVQDRLDDMVPEYFHTSGDSTSRATRRSNP
jgi:hypothetical protein